jgi:hypothetical protein
LHARSLDIPSNDHPNKMPFSGVLTRIDEPSDVAPEGSGGKRVLITMDAAKNALDSLLGMAVNFGFDDHRPREKVGVISTAGCLAHQARRAGARLATKFGGRLRLPFCFWRDTMWRCTS